MAVGISSGYMPVAPKDKNQSCLFCDYKAICRINELQPETDVEQNKREPQTMLTKSGVANV
jgi:ATP-dependent helicase/DNAse subunit B